MFIQWQMFQFKLWTQCFVFHHPGLIFQTQLINVLSSNNLYFSAVQLKCLWPVIFKAFHSFFIWGLISEVWQQQSRTVMIFIWSPSSFNLALTFCLLSCWNITALPWDPWHTPSSTHWAVACIWVPWFTFSLFYLKDLCFLLLQPDAHSTRDVPIKH